MAEAQKSSISLPTAGADSLEEVQGRQESVEMMEGSGEPPAEVAVEIGASFPPNWGQRRETHAFRKEQDAWQLLTIFPTEVWLLILDNVEEKESADFQRISNASPYFRTLLQPRSVEMLFPDVIKILIEKQPGLLYPPGDVLSLREVCRVWQDAVDLALQDQKGFYVLENEQIVQLGFEHPTEYFTLFSTAHDFRNFKEGFDSTHLTPKRNPFVFRGIGLVIPPRAREEHVTYFRACFQFLEKYGIHVWHCVISDLSRLDRMETLKFYKTDLKFLLRHMRNLKTCELQGSRDLQGRYLLKLAGSLAAAPLPFLPQLRKITGCGHSIPAPILRALVARNPDIDVVDASFFDSSSTELVNMCLGEMPNLKRLSLVLNTEAEFQAFCSAQAICPLQVLELRIEIELDDPKLLCNALETHFSRSLTQLWIEVPRSVGHQFGSDDWKLPNLKRVSVKLSDPIVVD